MWVILFVFLSKKSSTEDYPTCNCRFSSHCFFINNVNSVWFDNETGPKRILCGVHFCAVVEIEFPSSFDFHTVCKISTFSFTCSRMAFWLSRWLIKKSCLLENTVWLFKYCNILVLLYFGCMIGIEIQRLFINLILSIMSTFIIKSIYRICLCYKNFFLTECAIKTCLVMRHLQLNIIKKYCSSLLTQFDKVNTCVYIKKWILSRVYW